MSSKTPILHPDFLKRLADYDTALVDLFVDLRAFIFSVYPESNELLYHTQAITTVFSPSLKLGDAFCHIPIYNEHLNLGFNYGTLLTDPQHLLKGTGKLIRHIPIRSHADFEQTAVRLLVQQAVDHSLDDLNGKLVTRQTVSKMKS